MQANTTPTIIRMEIEDRMTIHVGSYRIHVLPKAEGYQLIVSKTNIHGETIAQNEPEWDTYETLEAAKQHAEEWVEIATEEETEWVDE